MEQSATSNPSPLTAAPGNPDERRPTTLAQPSTSTISARRDGVPSFVGTEPRSLSPLGRTLPGDPLTGVGVSRGTGWLMPIGAALVTAFVVFAIGGLVVRGWRSAEPTPVVTAAEGAPAAQAPAAGVPLSEVLKPNVASTVAAKPTAASSDEPSSEATDSTTRRAPSPPSTPAARPAAHRTPAAPSPTTDAAPVTVPQSPADFLPNTL